MGKTIRNSKEEPNKKKVNKINKRETSKLITKLDKEDLDY